MTTAQRPKVICYAIQVVSIRRYLGSWIISRQLLPATVHTRRERRRHVVGKIEVLEWIVDKGLHFVREVALRGETFQVNEQYWRQPRQGKSLRRFAHRLAVGTIPTQRTMSRQWSRRDNRQTMRRTSPSLLP